VYIPPVELPTVVIAPDELTESDAEVTEVTYVNAPPSEPVTASCSVNPAKLMPDAVLLLSGATWVKVPLVT
jgi:hypothetical protein